MARRVPTSFSQENPVLKNSIPRTNTQTRRNLVIAPDNDASIKDDALKLRKLCPTISRPTHKPIAHGSHVWGILGDVSIKGKLTIAPTKLK